MKLKEIPRTATFAWSPDPVNPTIVTGTAAGTIDADFSASTELELWKLDLLDHSVASFTASPSAHVETDARFHDVAMSGDGKFVVGALENGVVEAWNSSDLSPVARNSTAHSGAAKSVAFSPKEHSKFATGGAQGQVFIWNIQDLSSPFTPGTTASQRHDDVESVSWNSSALQILASGGNKGFASIWDTRRKREVLHLHHNSPASGSRVPISSVQWHPTNSTKLATASMDDNEPVICIWDLKNVNTPERILRGHSKGVLSLDWCRYDEDLMLSGGRDNATMLWNPTTGEQLGTYPISVEWAFKTKFNPHLPDLLASASFDGKISVQTLQDTTIGGESGVATNAAVKDGADFWESDTVMDAVHPSFKLQQPPKWLVKPVSAVFGFGGKLVVAKGDNVEVKSVTDSLLDQEVTKNFSEALQSHRFEDIVSSHTSMAQSSGWDLLESLMKGEQLSLPEEPLASNSDKSGENDDEFDIVPPYAPTEDFELLSSKHPTIVSAVLAKDFDFVVSELIKKGEAGDALLIASFGGADLIKRAQNAYLNAHASSEPYLRAAWSVATNSPNDIVEHSELKAWPSVLRAVLSNKDSSPNNDATYKLGKRLVDSGDRQNAVKVYLSGSNVGAAASLWLDEMPEIEKSFIKEGKCTAYVAHVRALQEVVEKLVVATAKLGLPKLSDPGADRLYSAFRDYADIAAQHGDLKLAKLFLDKLPEEYAADKQRVNVATEQKQTIGGRQRPVTGGSMAKTRPGPHAPPFGGAPAAPSPLNVNTPAVGRAASPMSPVRSTPNVAGNKRAAPARVSGAAAAMPAPAVPKMGIPVNPYAPQGISPAAASVAASQAAPVASVTPAAVPPPPPAGGASQSTAASASSSVPFKGWNDIPELPNNARRTPAAPTRVAPTRASVTMGPPSAYSTPRGSVSLPPPPPPVAGAAVQAHPVPPVQQPAQPFGTTQRPPNPYAPKPGSGPTSRAASVSKTNPYAPPPGTSSVPPSASPSPGPPRAVSRSAAAPPRARAAAPPAATPKVATPPPPPVATAATAAASISTTTPPPVAPQVAKPVRKASTGPSVIPDHLKPVVNIFDSELQRVRPVIEAQYAKQFKDTARRLQILYDQLLKLSEQVTTDLLMVSSSLKDRDHNTANTLLQTIATNYESELGEWFTGVKRLVKMSAGVPV